MADKPLIRHCRNCEYAKVQDYYNPDYPYLKVSCRVYYKEVEFPRPTALFCRYYKKRGRANEN